MEDFKVLKGAMKESMKRQLKVPISDSLARHSSEILQAIEQATDGVASRILDEAKIEEIAKAARQGATHMAIIALIRETTQEAMKHAKPMIDVLVTEFARVLSEATNEAIAEIIVEKLQNDI